MDDEPPISYDDVKHLFEHLDRVSGAGYKCDHTFALTKAFLEARNLPTEPMLTWLGYNGAGCDCEVMFNTAAEWEERVGCVSPADDA